MASNSVRTTKDEPEDEVAGAPDES